MIRQWKDFKKGIWCDKVDVSNFIKLNYKPYNEDESFLKKTTEKTDKVWKKCSRLLKEELKKHPRSRNARHQRQRRRTLHR